MGGQQCFMQNHMPFVKLIGSRFVHAAGEKKFLTPSANSLVFIQTCSLPPEEDCDIIPFSYVLCIEFAWKQPASIGFSFPPPTCGLLGNGSQNSGVGCSKCILNLP